MAGPPSSSADQWSTIFKLMVAVLATGVLAAGLLLPYVGGLGLAAGHEASKFLNTQCNLTETPPPRKTTLFASDGKTVIANLFTQDRQPVPLSQIPESLQQALVATEDRRFYSHHGVDMRGLIRSAVNTSSGDTQGGSTLTMQYVKQMRYYQAGRDVAKQQAAIDQNLNRKIEDAKCAIYLETVKHETKAQILDNYLNIAFFGENSYGIETAAQTYFGKHASKLTLPESALLVGLLRAPSEYDPFLNDVAAKERRNQVLQNLVDVGNLSQAQADQYKKTAINLATTSPPPVSEGCANSNSSVLNVPFFCDYAVAWLENIGKISDTLLNTGGLKIVTTLNANLQNSMQKQVNQAMPANSPMASVLPVVDPKTGNVLAMATSKKYGVKTSTKDATHTVLPIFTSYSAQGASTYKLFPLLTALSTGVPTNLPIATPSPTTGYRPNNCTTDAAVHNGDALESYARNETLQSATVKSSNTYFVGLADQVFGCDLTPIVNMAKRLGMKSLDQPSGEAGLTVAETILNFQRPGELVLGDIGTSPLELAGAYAAVANGGVYNAPAPIQSITDEGGEEIPVKRSPGVAVVAPQVAAQAVQILSGDTKFPGTSAAQFQQWYSQNPSLIAGKTGTGVAVVHGKETTQNGPLWFVGMTPNMVATSALINFDHPNAPAAGLPGVTNPAQTAYGAYASGIWLKALTPSLTGKAWTWPDPTHVVGEPVPPVVGMEMATAKTTLAAAGFKMVELDKGNSLMCASRQKLGRVAFAAPTIAPKGATITVCPSNGIPQLTYRPPPKPTRTATVTQRPGSTVTPTFTNTGGPPHTTITITCTPGNHGHGC